MRSLSFLVGRCDAPALYWFWVFPGCLGTSYTSFTSFAHSLTSFPLHFSLFSSLFHTYFHDQHFSSIPSSKICHFSSSCLNHKTTRTHTSKHSKTNRKPLFKGISSISELHSSPKLFYLVDDLPGKKLLPRPLFLGSIFSFKEFNKVISVGLKKFYNSYKIFTCSIFSGVLHSKNEAVSYRPNFRFYGFQV